MNKINLSIIIPSINPERLINIYDQCKNTLDSKYTFELIYVGPIIPSLELIQKENFKFYIDYGSPARSFQIGSLFAEGVYLAFLPDDGIIQNNAFTECLDLAYRISEIDGITLRYSEGVNYTGDQSDNLEYWRGKYHDDQKLDGVSSEWKIAPLFMMHTLYFRELGGLDCMFEHVNLNSHDLMYRLQKIGGTMHLSPSKVLAADWNKNYAQSILFQAYTQNDLPLFQKLYNNYDPNRLKIDYLNWINSPAKWQRRYNN